VIFREPGGLFTKGWWAIEIREQAVRWTACSAPIPSAICP